MKLSDRVIILREIDAMSYKGISELLTFQGFNSPRGCDLDSKIVFSIYKFISRFLNENQALRLIEINNTCII